MSHVAALFSMLERSLQSQGGREGLTVEDVYQRHLPYRSVRTELGIVEFAAYERGLLELLAGRGDYLRITDSAARDELGRELDSPNPILGLYRDYAASGVEILSRPFSRPPEPDTEGGALEADASFADAATPASESGSEAADPSSVSEPRTSWDAVPAATDPELDPGPEARPVPSAASLDPQEEELLPPFRVRADTNQTPPAAPSLPPEAESSRPDEADSIELPFLDRIDGDPSDSRRCIECEQVLPESEELQFCPFCGREQKPAECPECELELRPEWNFCIRCGTALQA